MPPSLMFGHEMFSSMAATPSQSESIRDTSAYSSSDVPQTLTMTRAPSSRSRGSFSRTNRWTPIPCKPIALSMPDGVSAMRGGTWPSRSVKNSPLTTAPLIIYASTTSSMLGGVTVKGLFLTEREGHVPPRIAETRSGMLNAIGLQGIGVHRFVREKLPRLRELGARVIVNVCGTSLDEYAEVSRILSDCDGVAADRK